MNIDIDQLVKKAKKGARKGYGIQFGHVLTGDELEKFAELVINDCVDIVLKERNPPGLNYKPTESIANAIKSRFGL
jgi:hypothetical protein